MKGVTVRYKATIAFDADTFDQARRLARGFRYTLRGDQEYCEANAKLLKLRDPRAEQPTEPDQS